MSKSTGTSKGKAIAEGIEVVAEVVEDIAEELEDVAEELEEIADEIKKGVEDEMDCDVPDMTGKARYEVIVGSAWIRDREYRLAPIVGEVKMGDKFEVESIFDIWAKVKGNKTGIQSADGKFSELKAGYILLQNLKMI